MVVNDVWPKYFQRRDPLLAPSSFKVDRSCCWRPPPDKNNEPVSHLDKKKPEEVPRGDMNFNAYSDPADLFEGKTPGSGLM